MMADVRCMGAQNYPILPLKILTLGWILSDLFSPWHSLSKLYSAHLA